MIVRHLCAVGAGPAIAAVFQGRIVLTEAVKAELTMQANGIPALRSFLASTPVTELSVDTAADEQEVEDIRIDMYTKKAARLSDTEHLGEAQCLFFAERDGYVFATNDVRARMRARASCDPSGKRPRTPGMHCVEVFHVVEVLLALVRGGVTRPAAAWQYYEQAVQSGLYPWPGYEIPGSRPRFMTEASTMTALWRADREGAD